MDGKRDLDRRQPLRGRRSLVLAGSAAISGVIAMLSSTRSAVAHIGAPPLHGDSDTIEPAVSGDNTGIAANAGSGVRGTSVGGQGVYGVSRDSVGVHGQRGGGPVGPAAVLGENFSGGAGVQGIATGHPGVSGSSTDGPGVFGTSATGNGVTGSSASNSAGVLGLHGGTSTGAAVEGQNQGTGPGVLGTAFDGGSAGVLGLAGAGTTNLGVQGTSPKNIGVLGLSDEFIGVRGRHTSATVSAAAVQGRNDGLGPGAVGRNTSDDPAVLGRAPIGFAVAGVHSSTTTERAAVLGQNDGIGAGVQGIAPGSSPGVLAQSGHGPFESTLQFDQGLALLAIGRTILRSALPSEPLAPGAVIDGPVLLVQGPATIEGRLRLPVGTGTIPVGERSVLVVDPSATPSSHISVTLTSSPGRDPLSVSDVTVSWIERAAGSFRINLTERTRSATPFTYTLIEPLA